jgi:hypothetical protein
MLGIIKLIKYLNFSKYRKGDFLEENIVIRQHKLGEHSPIYVYEITNHKGKYYTLRVVYPSRYLDHDILGEYVTIKKSIIDYNHNFRKLNKDDLVEYMLFQ